MSVSLRAAPCTPADLRIIATATASKSCNSHSSIPSATHTAPVPPHMKFAFPFVIGSEGLWEITAVGEGVSSLRTGDLAVPIVSGNAPGTVPESGTWRTSAILAEASLVRVPGGDGEEGRIDSMVAAHASSSVATALHILEDFSSKALEAGDRVVMTGASTAVAQASWVVFRWCLTYVSIL